MVDKVALVPETSRLCRLYLSKKDIDPKHIARDGKHIATFYCQETPVEGHYPILVDDHSGHSDPIKVVGLSNSPEMLENDMLDSGRKFGRALADKIGGEFVESSDDF